MSALEDQVQELPRPQLVAYGEPEDSRHHIGRHGWYVGYGDAKRPWCSRAGRAIDPEHWSDLTNEEKAGAIHAPPGPTYAVPIGDFTDREFPDIEELIPGMLATGEHTFASSKRGVGKSNFATAVGVSLAVGDSAIPGLEVRRATRVLYLDGEMQGAMVKQRLEMHAAVLGEEPRNLSETMRVVSRVELLRRDGIHLPTLSTPEGRDWLHRELDRFPAEVVFIDTVRALMRHPTESLNTDEGWKPCEKLLGELAARRVSAFYMHHDSTKTGEQLGTSAREFDPAYVLKLEKPKRKGGGFCRFKLSETKGRMGPNLTPRELVFEPGIDGEAQWSVVEDGQQTTAEKILAYEAKHPGATSTEVAQAVGTTDSYVRNVRHRNR